MTSEPVPSAAPSDNPLFSGDDDRAARQARWRIVFGSLTLVVGVMGFCMQGLGTGVVLFGGKLSAAAGLSVPPPPPVVAWATIVQFVVLAVLGVVVVAGAAMLIQRKPLGRTLVLGWAVARLVMVVVGIVIALVTLNPHVDWQLELAVSMREQLSRDPSVAAERLPVIPTREDAAVQTLRSLALANLFFATWPFVMAIVLTRRHVREEVESWRGGLGRGGV